MKRVLSLSTLYPNASAPQFGRFVASSMQALAARGDWHVTLINPIGIPAVAFGRYKALSDAAVDGIENGVEVLRPKSSLLPRVGARLNPSFIAKAVIPLAKRLHAKERFDLVDAQFFFPDGHAAAALAEALGLPLSIKARGSDITFWSGKDWALKQMIEAAARADGLLAVSEALKRDMVAIGMNAGKIRLHYTGLDQDLFYPREKGQARAEFRERSGIDIPQDAPLFTTVGGLVSHKGQDIAIDAMCRIDSAHLVIAGDGPERNALAAKAMSSTVADRVHFLGNVDHDLLPVLLSAANALVLPSEREGLANVWVEALACGTPLVIPDVGGAKEVVTDKSAGLITPRDAPAIAGAMRQILADPPAQADVTPHAARFSWEENAARLAAHYDRLIGA